MQTIYNEVAEAFEYDEDEEDYNSIDDSNYESDYTTDDEPSVKRLRIENDNIQENISEN